MIFGGKWGSVKLLTELFFFSLFRAFNKKFVQKKSARLLCNVTRKEVHCFLKCWKM